MPEGRIRMGISGALLRITYRYLAADIFITIVFVTKWQYHVKTIEIRQDCSSLFRYTGFDCPESVRFIFIEYCSKGNLIES